MPLTFEQFRAANVARCLKWHPAGIESWSASDWLTALAGELGELASLIKMINRERDGLPGNKFPVTKEHLSSEIADVLTYLDLLAASMGIDLAESAIKKFNEVSARVGFPDRIEVKHQQGKIAVLLENFPYYYGPTEADSDPGKKWHVGCGGEVLFIEDGLICASCGLSTEIEANSQEGKSEMNTFNINGVGLVGNDVAVVTPKTRMSPTEAMMFAAWLVSTAQIADGNLPAFSIYLDAVQST